MKRNDGPEEERHRRREHSVDMFRLHATNVLHTRGFVPLSLCRARARERECVCFLIFVWQSFE